MTTPWDAASRWTADGIGYGRAVVVRVVGPAAFEAGAVLLAADDGRIAGSVSPARIHAPIGLDLGGRSAAELAVAILAEVVKERRLAVPSPAQATVR